MKKISFLVFLLLLPALSLYAQGDEQFSHRGPLGRMGVVEARGLINVVTTPLELIGTAIREPKIQPKWWPVTILPRMGLNFVLRVVSGVNDALFFVWVVPFTDDITPLTDDMGLPEYPWQWTEYT